MLMSSWGLTAWRIRLALLGIDLGRARCDGVRFLSRRRCAHRA